MTTGKEDPVKQELECGVRAFAEAVAKSRETPIDDFDRLRILETAFNRLFMAVEHVSNSLVLSRYGNVRQKHFGSTMQLEEIRKAYGLPDIPRLYEESYSLRSYADYRKHPEAGIGFTHENLVKKIGEVRAFIEGSLKVVSRGADTSGIEAYLKKFSLKG